MCTSIYLYGEGLRNGGSFYIRFLKTKLPKLPDIVVEWLTFLLHIREVSGSNLHPGTGYPY
jgi:hypothetical protein